MWQQHLSFIVAGRSNNYTQILNHDKEQYVSEIHGRSSIVMIQGVLFYAIIFQSGMATSTSGEIDHQHNFPKTPRDGATHDYVLLIDVHISLQPRQIIRRQTRPLTQLQRWYRWWQISYSKTLQWWHNFNANSIHHHSLPQRWLWTAKSTSLPFLNGIGRPRGNHSSSLKLVFTSPSHTMQASNIGLKRQQLPNTWVLQLVPTLSPPYLALSIQCFWTTPDLIPVVSPYYRLWSLTLTTSPEKSPSIRPRSPLNRSGGKQHIFHVLRLQRIPTSKTVFDRPNNSIIRHL